MRFKEITICPEEEKQEQEEDSFKQFLNLEMFVSQKHPTNEEVDLDNLEGFDEEEEEESEVEEATCECCCDTFPVEDLSSCTECGQYHCHVCTKGDGRLSEICDHCGPCFEADGKLFINFTVDIKNKTFTTSDGEKYRYFKYDSDAADEYANYICDLAANDRTAITTMVGANKLISWALDQTCSDGHDCFDDWLATESESNYEKYFGEKLNIWNFSDDCCEAFGCHYFEEILIFKLD